VRKRFCYPSSSDKSLRIERRQCSFQSQPKTFPMESHDASEHLEHADHSPFKLRAALLVSVLAMVLAISNLGGSNASKESTQHNILAANAYAFYQAKNIRQTEYKIAADALEIALQQNDRQSPAARELMAKKLESYRKNIERYESEPETGDGKKELMARAKAHEHERDHALRQDPWFDYAEGLLQIGIVLASVAIITSTPALLGLALGLGVLGAASTLNGFFLWF